MGGKPIGFLTISLFATERTQIIPNAKRKTLLQIMAERILPDSIVYREALPSYNALDVATFRHFRINHSKSFVKGQTYINGIENFWNQAKRRLRKYNGVFST